MEKYHKVLAFFSYLTGVIAVIAILVDDRKNRLFSFHIWQAFFLHLFVGIVAAGAYVFILPQYILTVDVNARTPIFLQFTLIPLSIFMLLILTLSIVAANGIKFKIPLIGRIAEKISSNYSER